MDAPGGVHFVGRLDTRQSAEAALLAAAAGAPRLVLIEGPVGIGKTAAADWLLSRAALRGAVRIRANCIEDSAMPYGPLATILQSLGNGVDAIRSKTDPSAHPEFDLMNDVVSQLQRVARERLVSMLIDDLQWADPATLQIIQHVVFTLSSAAAAGTSMRAIVIVTCRSPAMDERAERIVQRLRREPIAVPLTLEPLSEREGTALVALRRGRSSPTQDRFLVRASGGNPLVLVSLLREANAGAQGLVTVDDALERRISALQPAARTLATRASVFGEGAFAWLAEVCPLTSAETQHAIDELKDADVLVVDRFDRFTFTHPQLRRATLASVSRPVALYQDVARRLEEALHLRTPEVAIALCRFWLAALAPANHPQLLRAALEGAGYAYGIGAWATAADLYEVLLDDPGLQDPALILEYRARAGTAADFDHDPDRCARHMDAIAPLARSMGDHRAWGQAVLCSARSRFTLGTGAVGEWIDVAAIEQFLAAGDRAPADLRARAYGLLAEMAFQAFDTERAEVFAGKARNELRKAPAEVEFWLSCAEGLAAMSALRLDQATTLFTSACAAAEHERDTWHGGAARSRRGITRYMQGDLEDALVDAHRSAEENISIANWAEHGVSECLRAMVLFGRGLSGEAFLAAEAAEVSYLRSDYAFVPLMLYPAIAAAHSMAGRPGEAIASLERLEERGGRGDRFRMLSDALHSGRGVVPKFNRRLRQDINSISSLAGAAELAQLVGDDDALVSVCAVLREAVLSGPVLTIGWPHFLPRLIGMGALRAGHHRQAESDLKAALDLADEATLIVESARVKVALAELAASDERHPRHDTAVSYLIEASRTFAALELVGLAQALHRSPVFAVPLRSVIEEVHPETTYVLFTDIVDSTALTAALGDRRWVVLLAEHDGITRSCIGRHGGRVVKHTGDGFCAEFTDAGNAVRAAIDLHAELQRCEVGPAGSSLRVRCGIAAGTTIAYGHDIHGIAVPTAARICAAAEPGGTMLSSLVRRHLGPGTATLEGPFALELKGLHGEQELYRVGR